MRLVTRRRRADEAILDTAGRHRTLLEHLPLVVLVLRAPDLEILDVGGQVERLLGLARDDALREGDVWAARLHPLDRDRVLGAWEEWLAGPPLEPFRSDYRLLADGGREVWVEDVTVFVADEEDGTRAYQRHLLDVTRQRRLEQDARQALRLELLGRRVAGVAHDFNNLLAVIAGYADRLTSQAAPGAREEGRRAITAAADRGAALVRQLLAFSRPQASHRRVVDLNDVVRDFAPMLGRLIGEDVEFELVLDHRCLPVEVDPVQIDQVLMNIIVNARDAMPDGGRLTITTRTVDPDSALVTEPCRRGAALVTVTDTGAGMDPTTQGRIFEPFFSTKAPDRGSGLGLATAQGIVGEAGGSIAVSSVPGMGTTFSIHLPLTTADMGSPAESRAEPTPSGGREAVLVVEDDPPLRELERLILEEAGYEVFTAENASEALSVAAERPIDALVVDVVMPGMSGPRLVDELATRGFDVPTVFVSGYGSDEISSRGVSTPNSAVIEKPFQADVLLRRVREVLDRPLLPPASREGRTARLVRCLACNQIYRPRARQELMASGGCPRCGYAGWIDAR